MTTKYYLTFALIIVLSICSCRNEEKAIDTTALQTEDELKPTINIRGTYSFGDDVETEPVGSVIVYPLNDSSALFYLYVCRGAPSYNFGEIIGEMTIKNNTGSYISKNHNQGFNCAVNFEFSTNQLKVTYGEGGDRCGFGHAVYAANTYKLIDNSIPKYFIDETRDTIFFRDLAGIFDLKQVDDKCKFCDETAIFEGNNCRYYTNDKYAVLAVSIPDETGEDFYIFDAKKQLQDNIEVALRDTLFSFSKHLFGDPYFVGLYGNYLLLDEGTSSQARGIILIDLNTKQKKLSTSSVSGIDSFDGKNMTYWNWGGSSLEALCPELKDSCCFDVIQEFNYNIKSKKVTSTGQLKCTYRE